MRDFIVNGEGIAHVQEKVCWSFIRYRFNANEVKWHILSTIPLHKVTIEAATLIPSQAPTIVVKLLSATKKVPSSFIFCFLYVRLIAKVNAEKHPSNLWTALTTVK